MVELAPGAAVPSPWLVRTRAAVLISAKGHALGPMVVSFDGSRRAWMGAHPARRSMRGG